MILIKLIGRYPNKKDASRFLDPYTLSLILQKYMVRDQDGASLVTFKLGSE